MRATWQMGQPGWSSTARRAGSMSLTLRFLGKSSARDGRIWECKESSRQAQLSGPFTFAQRNAHAAKGGAHRSSARTALRSTCWTRQLLTNPLACPLYRSTCDVRYRYSQACLAHRPTCEVVNLMVQARCDSAHLLVNTTFYCRM